MLNCRLLNASKQEKKLTKYYRYEGVCITTIILDRRVWNRIPSPHFPRWVRALVEIGAIQPNVASSRIYLEPMTIWGQSVTLRITRFSIHCAPRAMSWGFGSPRAMSWDLGSEVLGGILIIHQMLLPLHCISAEGHFGVKVLVSLILPWWYTHNSTMLRCWACWVVEMLSLCKIG